MGCHSSCLSCCKPERCKRKLLLLGSSGVGKSCLLLNLRGHQIPSGHDITLIDKVELEIQVDKQEVDLEIWDTPGRESLDRLRTLSYPETDVLLLCFSLDSPSSLDSVKEDWYPIVHYFLPGVPLVLVGTKADLRKSPKTTEGLVTSEAAEEMMKSMGAAFYRETSAMTGENVRELFYEAIKITLSRWYRARSFLPSSADSEKSPLLSSTRSN